MSAAAGHSSPFLDTIWARLIAAAIAVGGIVLFLAANWDRLTPAGGGALAGDSAYEECIEERIAAIANLEQEAGLSRKQVELHRQRAEAYCQQRMSGQ
jgi:hypothetical protein